MDQMKEQVKILENWRKKEEDVLRRVVIALFVGVILVTIGGAGGIWRVQNLAEDNRRLIAQVDTLNRSQAEGVYQDCLARNQRSVETGKALSQLVDANIKDGNKSAAAVWQKYLKATREQKLPPCEKPAPGPTK